MTTRQTVFRIPQMDCPCEEQIIRMKLRDNPNVRHLSFDLAKRQLTVYYGSGGKESISGCLKELGWRIEELSDTLADAIGLPDDKRQKSLLYQVLAINFVFFLIEVLFGWLSHSMGLIADSLDMLADSGVYALALFAVGGSLLRKQKTALWAGCLQIALALWGFAEVLRRFFGKEQLPDFYTMMVVSLLALAANAWCLYLLKRHNSQDAHMRAGMIFTSNDIAVNLGVIAAALCVKWFASPVPDLAIGALVFLLVMNGAWRILRLAK